MIRSSTRFFARTATVLLALFLLGLADGLLIGAWPLWAGIPAGLAAVLLLRHSFRLSLLPVRHRQRKPPEHPARVSLRVVRGGTPNNRPAA